MTAEYKEKLEQGTRYQDWVVEQLYNNGLPIISYSSKHYQYTVGENKAGLEIKLDTNWQKTKNLYIETAEKSNKENKNFIDSGIYRCDNTWLYLIGDYTKIFILAKNQLRHLHKQKRYREVQTETSRGFLLPVAEAERVYAIKIISITTESNNEQKREAS